MVVPRVRNAPQLFFEVWAKNALILCSARRLLHFGQRTLRAPCSASVMVSENLLPHFLHT